MQINLLVIAKVSLVSLGCDLSGRMKGSGHILAKMSCKLKCS